KGEMDRPEFIRASAAMSLLGEPGRTALEGLARFMAHQKGMDYGQTKLETLAELNKATVDGTITPDRVLAEHQKGNLDQRDAEEYLRTATQIVASGGATGRQSVMIGEAVKQLNDLIEHPFLEQGLIGGSGNTQAADQLKTKLQQAETAFL